MSVAALMLYGEGISREFYRITKRFEVGRSIWRSSSPPALFKQTNPEPVAWDHFQTALEYPHGWRLYSLSGRPVLVLVQPHNGKVFPCVQRDPPVI